MVTITKLSSLAAALHVERGELISLVGGGGKTTSLFTLGSQLQGTTVLTTTTKMGADQAHDHPLLIDPSDEQVEAALAEHGRILAWKEREEHRAVGVSAETCDRWFEFADNLVTEADGSRKRPFKAPTDYEPVIPSRTTLLVGCIGVSAIGAPIAERCHRPEVVAGLAECSVNDVLTPSRAAAVLLHPNGSQKHRPANARFIVALHRVTPQMDGVIDELADLLGNVDLVAVREDPTKTVVTNGV